jgi:virulence factor
MRIAMIGLGDIACKAYLPIMANHPSITPILCTRNTARLAELVQQYRITEYCEDASTLLLLKPDAVMIHSNTESHAQLARQCLQAGIPTFIDKPISYQLEKCEDLLNLAEQKHVPLAVGFNRRCAPLISALANQSTPIQIIMQKNRINLAADARVFIYDDFIHVLDTLRFLAPNKTSDLQIFAREHQGKLGALQVSWQAGKTALTASMNRISGVTEERLEFFAEQQKWQIDNLASGNHWHNKQVQPLGFGDWEDTLFKRGFKTMIDNWVNQINQQTLGNHADILATHALCEKVVIQAAQDLAKNG